MKIETQMTEEMKKILTEAEAAIDKVVNWTAGPVPAPNDHDAHFFMGDAGDGWSFVITDFSIEEQGFPPGSRGVDGAARHSRGIVLHLTRELAQKALDRALAKKE